MRHSIRITVVLMCFILFLSIMTTGSTGTRLKASVPESDDTIYYSYDELTELLQELHTKYTDIFSYRSLGKTHEGRDIWLVKISDAVETNDSEEPDLLYTGGEHGNEKPGYQNIIYTMKALTENYSSYTVNETFSNRIRNIVNHSELLFIPMINPDGCEANKRKNTRVNPCILGSTLFSGVDICRNYDYRWDDADRHPFRYILIPRTIEDITFLIEQKNFHIFERSVVRYPTLDFGSIIKSGFYRGPYPFSEPESQAIRQVIENYSIMIWLNYHIFGEEIRLPEVPTFKTNDDAMMFYSIAENISMRDGYKIFTPPSCLNQSGGGMEWSYTTHNTFSFLIELCPSMSPAILQDAGFMSTVFEQHLSVNLYVAEKALEMTSH